MRLFDEDKIFDQISGVAELHTLKAFLSFPEKDDKVRLEGDLRARGVTIVQDPMEANLIITYGGVNPKPRRCLYIEVMDDGQVEIHDRLSTVH